MNNLFILIYLTTLSITFSSCTNFSNKEVDYRHQKNKVPYSSPSETKDSQSSKSQDSHYNNIEIDFEKIKKVNQENFQKSQLLSIKSDSYHGEPAIHITSRNGNVRKEIIYSRTLDKKLDSYTHYDKHYDENKKINLTNIITLEEAINISYKTLNYNFNIDEWKLTFEDDEQAIVWEIEGKDVEVQLDAQTGEIYDVDL